MTRWTEEDVAALLKRRGVPSKTQHVDTSKPPFLPPSVAGMYAKGRLPSGAMNRTEAEYSQYLAQQLAAGEIQYWKFEPTGLRLADRTFYHPDFGVLTKEGFYEFREVKGRMMDDANVKIKVAASQHPFRFVVVRKRPNKDGGGWSHEDVSA